jgi:hypothetical protein
MRKIDREGAEAARFPFSGRFAPRVAAHLGRMRREGVGRVVVDDVRRARAAVRRAVWRMRHDCSPNAVPVFIVGIQRSGTDMLVEAFAESAEAEVHNESRKSRAFSDFALRDDVVIRGLVAASRSRCVVFKPLCDSHRLVHLIEELGTPRRGRAIWIYRSVDGRVRSVLGKWPENNRRVVRAIAEGRAGWEAGGLSEERLELVRGFDHDEMTQESGAALLWYLRNCLFFDLGLDRRDDVALVSYERFVAEPRRFMVQLCELAGISFRPRMITRVAERPPATSRVLDIDPAIRRLCGELHERLEAELVRRLARGSLTGESRADGG